MIVIRKNEKHIEITFTKREFVTIFSADKKTKLIIDHKKGKLSIVHFTYK